MLTQRNQIPKTDSVTHKANSYIECLSSPILSISLVTLLLPLFFLSWSCDSDRTQKLPKKPVAITIIKYATHPAMDEVESAFVRSLKESFADGEISFSLRNADANRSRAKQLAEFATSNNVDLIVAFGTAAAQAVASTPSKINFLYGAVSDPEGAGLLPSSRTSGIKNVSIEIIREALKVLHEAFPSATRLGTIWNPAEQNSRFVQGLISKVAPEFGFSVRAREVTSVNQIKSTVEDLLRDVDAIYSANDNLVNLGARSVSVACREFKKPFMIGELSAMVNGPTLAVGVNYTETGKALAKMAKTVIQTGSVASTPPSPPPPAQILIDEGEIHRIGGIITETLSQVAVRYAPRR